MTSLNGLRVVVVPTLCRKTFARWRRTNRNNRIARKWRKKYGAVTECRAENGYIVGGHTLHVCPHAFEAIRKATGT